MSQATIKTINLPELLTQAKQETQALMKQGIDISDPSLITPLEATANQYPEIAQDCNQVLMELVREHMNLLSQQPPSPTVNEF
ncbi:MAG: hypothetical protein AB4426_27005 [Xenococcaceae cyanobacterium]